MGQNCFVPGIVPGKKSHLQFCPGDKNDTFFFGGPPPAVGDDDAVAGQRLSILAASADHSATAAASAGDKDNDNNKENKPLPQAGLDANGGGRLRPDECLASARQELVSSNANAHGGRTTSSNGMTNEGGRTAGNAPCRVNRQQSAKKWQL